MSKVSNIIIDKYLQPLGKKYKDNLSMDEVKKIFIMAVELLRTTLKKTERI